MTRPRRAGVAPTIGLVVEGETEFSSLPLLHREGLIARCPPLKVVNLGGIGSERTAVGIAKMVVPKIIAHQEAGRPKVVVCLDREQRSKCAGELASEILSAVSNELAKRRRTSEGVNIVVSDRSFEAWILADARGLHERRVFGAAPRFHRFEGEPGGAGGFGI